MLRLFAISKRVADGSDARAWRSRLAFLAGAIPLRAELAQILRGSGSLGRHIAQRPETLGAVVWPYISTNWDAKERLARIRDHFAALDEAVPTFDFEVDRVQVLCDLSDLLPGLTVVLDQPKWFMREGQLCFNLFVHDKRVFSLAFSFALQPSLVAYVGAVQGRSIEGILETYKQITTALHGMRPRDFLIEAFLALCRSVGVQAVYAVADARRHHRSAYFGNGPKSFALDYDELWRERGGDRHNDDFFVLPIGGAKRDLSTVPSKKRSMYRKRYELIDRFEATIAKGVQNGFAQRHRDEFAK